MINLNNSSTQLILYQIMLQIGYHLSQQGSGQDFLTQLKLHVAKGLTAFQVNLSPLESWSAGQPFTPTECQTIKDWTMKNQIFGVVHGKYLYNFCRHDVALGRDQLIQELRSANAMGCSVVIHQGKNVTDAKLTRLEALNNYVRHLTYVLESTDDLDTGLILENSCHAGTELGYNLNELAYIYHQFEDHLQPRIGFCLDLCHVFVAGELDLRQITQVKSYFDDWDHQIGLDKLQVIHWNDSNCEFNAKVDRHGDVLCGYITNPLLGGSTQGVKYVAQLAHQRQIPMIFETPCNLESIPDQSQWQMEIVKGWAVQDDGQEQDFLIKYPNVYQMASDFYAKIPAKSHSTCQCQEHESVQIKVKIPIKLKTRI